MCKIGGGRARSLWLTLRHVDSDPDRPGDAEYRDEDVDRDDNHPTACSGVVVDCVARVESADQKHGDALPEATVDGTVSTAPFVGKEKSGDSHAEYYDCRDARSEKGSF